MTALLAAALHLAALLDACPPVVVTQRGTTVGTAVVVDCRGFLVTCLHCVGRRERVAVEFSDGGVLTAAVVFRQPADDLALLRIDGDRYRYVPLKLADGPPRVGQPVRVLGHPMGYRFSLTAGVVSALGREITLPDGDPLADLIQTDAAINPGNSGGPLLNDRGELLGIVVAIREGSQGIGFAIPAAAVRRLMKHVPPEHAKPPP